MDVQFEISWKAGKVVMHASSAKEADARGREYLQKQLALSVVAKSDDRVAVEIASEK